MEWVNNENFVFLYSLYYKKENKFWKIDTVFYTLNIQEKTFLESCLLGVGFSQHQKWHYFARLLLIGHSITNLYYPINIIFVSLLDSDWLKTVPIND